MLLGGSDHRIVLAIRALLLVSVVWMVAGCTRQPSRPKTYPVTGTVTLNARPVEGATVTFIPKEGSAAEPKPQAASAITDAEGRYHLGTFASGDGAIPGEYLVKVAKYVQPQETSRPADTPESEMDAFLKHQKGNVPKTGPGNELPPRYANEKTSGLFFSVQPGENTFEIKLAP